MLCKIYSIHSLGEYFPGGDVFLITGILVQSDPVINSSMQQPRKLLPVIYCATYLEPALLMDGLMCSWLIFRKLFVKIKSLEKAHEPYSLHVTVNWMWKKTNHPTKIFYEIIIPKLRKNRCNWFANSYFLILNLILLILNLNFIK